MCSGLGETTLLDMNRLYSQSIYMSIYIKDNTHALGIDEIASTSELTPHTATQPQSKCNAARMKVDIMGRLNSTLVNAITDGK